MNFPFYLKRAAKIRTFFYPANFSAKFFEKIFIFLPKKDDTYIYRKDLFYRNEIFIKSIHPRINHICCKLSVLFPDEDI